MSKVFNLKKYLIAQEYFPSLPKIEKPTEQELIDQYNNEYKEEDFKEDFKDSNEVNGVNEVSNIKQKKLFRAYVFFSDGKSEPIEGTWIVA